MNNILVFFFTCSLALASDITIVLGPFSAPDINEFVAVHGATPGNPLLLTTTVGSVSNVTNMALVNDKVALASLTQDGFFIQSAVVDLNEKSIALSSSVLISGLIYDCEFAGFAFSGELVYALAWVENDYFRNATIYSIDVGSGIATLLLNEPVEEFDTPSGLTCFLPDNFLLQHWADEVGFVWHGILYKFNLKTRELHGDRLKLKVRQPVFDVKKDLIRFYDDEGSTKVVHATISEGKILSSVNIDNYLVAGFLPMPMSQIATSNSYGFFVERTLSNFRLSGLVIQGLFFCDTTKICATIPFPSSFESVLVASDFSTSS